jgi:RNA polymerase sigma factor (sigma-70 family)
MLAFSLEPGLEVVGHADSLAAAQHVFDSASRIDVVLIDLDLPDGHGIMLIPELHAKHQSAEALILTASTRRVDFARAVEAGAAGLMHKGAELSAIMEAVNKLAAGEALVTRQELIELVRIAGQERERAQTVAEALAQLSPREREVLLALADGLSDREIAERLFISRETVHTHMTNLMRKLEVESRLQALIFAVRSGLITLD